MARVFDCVACDACCCNPLANVAEGYEAYVEISDPRSKLLADASWRKKLVREDAQGRPHLRLHGERCAALHGAVGTRVRCSIYAHRPKACRRVQPGDRDCLRSRAERGLS